MGNPHPFRSLDTRAQLLCIEKGQTRDPMSIRKYVYKHTVPATPFII